MTDVWMTPVSADARMTAGIVSVKSFRNLAHVVTCAEIPYLVLPLRERVCHVYVTFARKITAMENAAPAVVCANYAKFVFAVKNPVVPV